MPTVQTKTLSPAYDNKIVRKYSARTIEHKLENKRALQEEIGWIDEPKQPIVCIPTGMTEKLGGQLLESVLPGILELSAGVLIRGRGSPKYGEMFTKLAGAQSHRLKIIADDDVSYRKMLAGSDIALFLCDPKGSAEVADALRYGVIPVSLPSELLENYNPVQESGNAFIYEESTPWQCFASLVRALETLRFPYDWRTIQRHAMDSIEGHGSTPPGDDEV